MGHTPKMAAAPQTGHGPRGSRTQEGPCPATTFTTTCEQNSFAPPGGRLGGRGLQCVVCDVYVYV